MESVASRRKSTTLIVAFFGGVMIRGKKEMLQGQGRQLEKKPEFHADGHIFPMDYGHSQILVAAILSWDFVFKIQIISLA